MTTTNKGTALVYGVGLVRRTDYGDETEYIGHFDTPEEARRYALGVVRRAETCDAVAIVVTDLLGTGADETVWEAQS